MVSWFSCVSWCDGGDYGVLSLTTKGTKDTKGTHTRYWIVFVRFVCFVVKGKRPQNSLFSPRKARKDTKMGPQRGLVSWFSCASWCYGGDYGVFSFTTKVTKDTKWTHTRNRIVFVRFVCFVVKGKRPQNSLFSPRKDTKMGPQRGSVSWFSCASWCYGGDYGVLPLTTKVPKRDSQRTKRLIVTLGWLQKLTSSPRRSPVARR